MNTIITITNIDSLDAKNFELFSKYLVKKGLEFEINQTESISAPKKTSAPKSKDTFDREKYLQIAKQSGCLGKHGVWKSARSYVYAVLDGEITIEQCVDLVRQLKEAKGWA